MIKVNNYFHIFFYLVSLKFKMICTKAHLTFLFSIGLLHVTLYLPHGKYDYKMEATSRYNDDNINRYHYAVIGRHKKLFI